MYNHPALVELPWYALAGNHDYYGNVEAQIALSQSYPRWKFPSLFHEHSFNWTETEVDSHDNESPSIARTYSIQIIMIDTAVLTGLVDRIDIPFMQPPGPKDPEVAEMWYSWLEEKLNQSTADYIWVAGHYPVYSVCWQGSSLEMIHNVQPLLNKYGAHYMVSLSSVLSISCYSADFRRLVMTIANSISSTTPLVSIICSQEWGTVVATAREMKFRNLGPLPQRKRSLLFQRQEQSSGTTCLPITTQPMLLLALLPSELIHLE